MGKASVNFRHEWVGRLLAVHYGCRISILIIPKQTSLQGPSGTNGRRFYYSSFAGIEDVIIRAAQSSCCMAYRKRSITILGGIAYFSWGQSNQRGRVMVGHSCKIKEEEGGKSRAADKDITLCTHDSSSCRSSSHQNIHVSTLSFESPSSCHKPPFFPNDGCTLPETILKKNTIFLFLFLFFSITIAFSSAFWSLGEMWLSRRTVKLKLLEPSFYSEVTKGRNKKRCTCDSILNRKLSLT